MGKYNRGGIGSSQSGQRVVNPPMFHNNNDRYLYKQMRNKRANDPAYSTWLGIKAASTNRQKRRPVTLAKTSMETDQCD